MPQPAIPLIVLAAALALLTAACSAPRDHANSAAVDPAIAAALAVPLLTDPDLVTQNARLAAIEADPFAADHVPPPPR